MKKVKNQTAKFITRKQAEKLPTVKNAIKKGIIGKSLSFSGEYKVKKQKPSEELENDVKFRWNLLHEIKEGGVNLTTIRKKYGKWMDKHCEVVK